MFTACSHPAYWQRGAAPSLDIDGVMSELSITAPDMPRDTALELVKSGALGFASGANKKAAN